MDLDNLLVVGDDPSGDAGAAYDLTNLYAAQSNTDWFFGFSASVSATDMTYGLYIDVDHVDGSGATAPPPERSTYAVSTTSAHQPEYAIFIDQIGGVVEDSG